MVEAYWHSAKHQRDLFHENESSQAFLKHAIPDFADKLLFVSFQQNKPIAHFLILYMKCIVFRMSTENAENW